MGGLAGYGGLGLGLGGGLGGLYGRQGRDLEDPTEEAKQVWIHSIQIFILRIRIKTTFSFLEKMMRTPSILTSLERAM